MSLNDVSIFTGADQTAILLVEAENIKLLTFSAVSLWKIKVTSVEFMLARIKLRYILFITFTFISSVPVFFLSGWVQQSALEKEVDSVREMHLLVAQNLTGDLKRYIIDVESSFRLVADNLARNNLVEGFAEHIDSLYFRYITTIDSDGVFIDTITSSYTEIKKLKPEILTALKPIMLKAVAQPEVVFYSNMMRDYSNAATFYLIKAIDNEKYVIGSLSTKHIIEVQQKVSFGERGHAAIVDKTGRAIAHPIQNWVDTMKDMSFLPPVKSMMQGKTGVSQFYTPAMQADMIAGYTFVPVVGWGVMVPQPFEELEVHAAKVRMVAIMISLLGIGVAGLISWFLAGILARPIQAVVKSTKLDHKTNNLSKVVTQYHFIPFEFKELLGSFNNMVDVIRDKTMAIEDTSNLLFEAQRIAHVGNWEWNIEKDTIWCSEEFYRICKISSDTFKGNFNTLLKMVHPEDKEMLSNAITQAQGKGKKFSLQHRIVLPNGNECYVQHEGELHKGKGHSNQRIIGTIHDITDRKHYEMKLLHQANYDDLTDLPNRTLLIERLTQEIGISYRNKQRIGLLSIDLDDFKIVNDTYGHLIGDKFLQEAAVRLQNNIRNSDTLARLGGDEYCVILRDIKNDDCSIVAKKIISSFTKVFSIDGCESFVGASIGISIYPDDNEEPNTLIRNADIALYRVKESGRNNFCFFKKEMDLEVTNRMNLSNDLRKAIDQNEFVIHYQPIIDLHTGEISSAEALVRWNHPKRGLISPDKFIPLAEQTGIIGPLGEWVLKTSCESAASWSDNFDTPPRISVNLSVRQLQLGLTKEIIQNILTSSGLNASQLILEITESLVMSDTDEVIGWMKAVRNIGVSFSVDDFGTGYSSLSYLKQLPVDVLKIDRAFIKDISTDIDGKSLVKAIIAIGKSFRLKIVAEGVENDQQLTQLKELKCDYIQGYYYSRPLPLEDFNELLMNWDPSNA